MGSSRDLRRRVCGWARRPNGRGLGQVPTFGACSFAPRGTVGLHDSRAHGAAFKPLGFLGPRPVLRRERPPRKLSSSSLFAWGRARPFALARRSSGRYRCPFGGEPMTRTRSLSSRGLEREASGERCRGISTLTRRGRGARRIEHTERFRPRPQRASTRGCSALRRAVALRLTPSARLLRRARWQSGR